MAGPGKPTGIINIKGKDYETVAFRVTKLRDAHPDWTIQSVIHFRDEKCVVMEARILDAAGRLLANGHAEEYRQSSAINKTSAVENCETSAIGRALAAVGYGGTEFSSAHEQRAKATASGEVSSSLIDEATLEVWRDEIDEAASRDVLTKLWQRIAEACTAAKDQDALDEMKRRCVARAPQFKAAA